MKSHMVFAALAASLPFTTAHTRFTTLFINDQSQGDGTCIRMNQDPSTTTGFVDGITNPDMACGVGGAFDVGRTCSANAGDKISLLHRMWADGSQPGAIDPSHLGSTAIYMKKMGDAEATDPFATEAAGDGWFKVFYDGYSDGKWGTTKMNDNNGLVSSSIPSDIASGYYLIRSEILTMQNVNDGSPPKINPQFYIGCAQVYVEGTGSSTPAETAAIPGWIDDSTPALSYNIYKQFPPEQPFEEFGPALYTSGNAGDQTGTALSQPSTPSTSNAVIVGSCPADTVLQVGDMCITELWSWSDDTPGYLPKCWEASDMCWKKLDQCWNNLSPAVDARDKNVGCNVWNEKCLNLVEWCHAGNLEGPPNAGTVLTPPAKRSVSRRGSVLSPRRTARGSIGR